MEINLIPVKFTCPFCKKPKITFVDADKLDDIENRTMPIQKILPERYFSSSYREIFVSNICSSCMELTFGDPVEDCIDADVDNHEEMSNAKSDIFKMWNNYYADSE